MPPAAAFDARDPKSVAVMLQDFGYRARLTKSENGAPMIESRTARADFSLVFNNCSDGRDCTGITAVVSWTYDGSADPLAAVNDWNMKWNYGRAWWDGDSEIVGLDVAWTVIGGVSRETFEDQFVWWCDAVADYSKFLDETLYLADQRKPYDGSTRDI